MATYQQHQEQQRLDAEAFMEQYGDELGPEELQQRHVAGGSDLLEIVISAEDSQSEAGDDDEYVPLNSGGSDIGYDHRAFHGVTELAHWITRKSDPVNGQEHGQVAGHSIGLDMGATLDPKKFKAHQIKWWGTWILDNEGKKVAIDKRGKRGKHGLEFMQNSQGELLKSTRPSTLAKVRMAYKKQVAAEACEHIGQHMAHAKLRQWKGSVYAFNKCPAIDRPIVDISLGYVWKRTESTMSQFVGPIQPVVDLARISETYRLDRWLEARQLFNAC